MSGPYKVTEREKADVIAANRRADIAAKERALLLDKLAEKYGVPWPMPGFNIATGEFFGPPEKPPAKPEPPKKEP